MYKMRMHLVKDDISPPSHGSLSPLDLTSPASGLRSLCRSKMWTASHRL